MTGPHDADGRIGILGVGHLAEALVRGFLRGGIAADRLVLAPRGHGPALSRTLGLPLAADNAALVEECGTIILAVRPKDAVAAVSGLPWGEGQLLISTCAGVAIDALAEAAAPAGICRVMPLTAAAFGASPTVLYPDHPDAHALLAHVGPVIPLAAEAEFEVATVSAAAYGWLQAIAAGWIDWQAAAGLDPATARRLAAATLVAAGRNIEGETAPVDALLAALTTPGGITEAGLQRLQAHEIDAAWVEACEAVRAKLKGA
ncbi:pyrroline-5-carboxylate reductase family protein [Acuticoccus kandeliae]|uniref:pyrroline-5-carboxylate reductase family protein n=1 Tax=Acuticoccus kandeliae TaxID=2073160 RepID=UPI000D3E1358|nr:pyrroline-5-carboxylate reductase dimerization domain-containing protein [Acuticoccus kandeliae]